MMLQSGAQIIANLTVNIFSMLVIHRNELTILLAVHCTACDLLSISSK